VRASSSFLSSVYAVLTFCMIKCFIVVNNTGVPRLTKFYEHCVRFCLAFSSHSFHNYLLTMQRNATQPLANNYDNSTNMQTPERQQELVRNVFEALHSRADGLCNFVEDAKRFGKGVKLVYRHFATLYFAALVDENESELGILDLIHVFVETLDSCFENVCELDLVFNFHKVNLNLIHPPTHTTHLILTRRACAYHCILTSPDGATDRTTLYVCMSSLSGLPDSR